MKKHLQPWVWTIVGSIGFIASLLVKTIIYLFTSEFDFSGLLGLLTGLFIIIINIIIVKTKKDKTPSIDERTSITLKILCVFPAYLFRNHHYRTYYFIYNGNGSDFNHLSVGSSYVVFGIKWNWVTRNPFKISESFSKNKNRITFYHSFMLSCFLILYFLL